MLAKKKRIQDPQFNFHHLLHLLKKKKDIHVVIHRHRIENPRDIHVVSPPLPSYYHFQISGLFASF